MLRKFLLGALASAALSAAAVAQAQFGTAAEAKALLEQAATILKNAPGMGLTLIKHPSGGYRDRDLSIYCFDMADGQFIVHPNIALIEADVRTLKDKDGSPWGQKIYDAAQEGTFTTVGFKAPKPGTTETVEKEAYVTRVSDLGCGIDYYK